MKAIVFHNIGDNCPHRKYIPDLLSKVKVGIIDPFNRCISAY